VEARQREYSLNTWWGPDHA